MFLFLEVERKNRGYLRGKKSFCVLVVVVESISALDAAATNIALSPRLLYTRSLVAVLFYLVAL